MLFGEETGEWQHKGFLGVFEHEGFFEPGFSPFWLDKDSGSMEDRREIRETKRFFQVTISVMGLSRNSIKTVRG